MFKNFLGNPIEQKNIQKIMQPSYIKNDGTKVYEKDEPYGHVVYEISPDKFYISRVYNNKEQLIFEYARHKNLETGRQYDEFDRVAYRLDIVYDENNKEAMRSEDSYTYHDNGNKKSETVKELPGNLSKVSNFDENGKLTEMYELRGSVKTWFDEQGKPIKREIDRGSGGIITEDLRKG